MIERRLLNRSDKPVVQASFDLFFYNEQGEPDKLLFRRPIPTMSYVNAPILPGASFPTPAARKADPPRLQSFSIPSIKDLFTPLIKDGVLNGSYLITIGVTRVLFEDGSSWEFQSEAQAPAQP